MIHIYCGEGKGKTTSAIGLGIRFAGAKKRVLMFQFLKDNSSSERNILKNIFTLIDGYEFKKPSWEFSKDEIKELSFYYENITAKIAKSAKSYDMLILDEAMAAVNFGYLKCSTLLKLIDSLKENTEIVLTGRDPRKEFLDIADYISEIKSIKNPYTKGISARKGIEF